jgi:hypothetical protein
MLYDEPVDLRQLVLRNPRLFANPTGSNQNFA